MISLSLALLAPTGDSAGAQGLDQAERSRLEWQRFHAKTTWDYLAVAERFARAGLAGEAKLTVDEAAKVAKTAGEWHAVAGAYQQLGFESNAELARRRARGAVR